MILKSFIKGKEFRKIFYSMMGWLRRQNTSSAWVTKKDKSGGRVFIDLGVVILDMAFWMMGFAHVRRVSAMHLSNTTTQVEDTSLVSITVKDGPFLVSKSPGQCAWKTTSTIATFLGLRGLQA
ncbi:MAG: Gfo/Idh/MocA family oxidoreductase [Ignavibacteria bacterium]|nr:Gfo/Idh/MocA family oxidoreductase [Ignavibacteria bacterium]